MIASLNVRLLLFTLIEVIDESFQRFDEGFHHCMNQVTVFPYIYHEYEKHVPSSNLDQIMDYLSSSLASLTFASFLTSLCLAVNILLVVFYRAKVRHRATKRHNAFIGKAKAANNLEAHTVVSGILSGILQNIDDARCYSKKHREALEVADATVRQILYNMYKVPTLAAEPQDTMAPNDSGDNSGGAQKTWVLPKITITYYHEPRKDRKFRRGVLKMAENGPVTIRQPLALLP